MRFVVTGASGFAGAHLVAHLQLHGHTIVPFVTGDASGERIDARDADAVRSAVERIAPDGVFHLAAVAFVPRAERARTEVRDVNVGGTANVLDAAREVGARTLVVSSGVVYGAVPDAELPVAETRPLAPSGPYAESKAAAEAECERRRELQDIVRVRPFNHTGPGQSSEYVCSAFARQIAEIEIGVRRPVITHGDLAPERDFCDVRDVVRAYLDVFEHGRAGEVYNVCSGRPVKISRILEMLSEMSETPAATEAVGERMRGRDLDRVYGSADKIRDEVDWSPLIPLRTTLKDLLDDWRRRARGSQAVGAGTRR